MIININNQINLTDVTTAYSVLKLFHYKEFSRLTDVTVYAVDKVMIFDLVYRDDKCL